MLKENTLFGEVDKVQEAIDLLRKHEPPEGYYMAFSGGKDSTVAYDLCKRAGVKFEAHYSLTTVDPPELVYYIKDNYPDVIKDRPKMSMWQVIEKEGILPSRIMRYCCRIFKEGGGKGFDVVTGVRAEESARRAKRKQYEQKNHDKKHKFLHVIFNWTKEDVWEYIHANNLPYCELYDEGFERVGCVLCPMQSQANTLRDLARFPKYVENYKKAADRAIIAREGKESWKNSTWKNGEEMFDWWIGERRKVRIAEDCNAIPLFSEDDGSIL